MSDRPPSGLLETKLHAPGLRRTLVARPRLEAMLGDAEESKLVLVSAPAGSGKTTLLAAWIANADAQVASAWLTLDPADNDSTAFWSHFVAALQAAIPSVERIEAGLRSEPDRLPARVLLTALINELRADPREIRMVLDDYHVIDTAEVVDGIAFFLEHLPQNTHVAIATRSDPPLPLARLRASGELVEIRATDLRFTDDEAEIYFNQVMGLGLTDEEVGALEARTEGWVAALQLAALSLRGRSDAAEFIAGFAGSDRYIVDYLVEEVLHRQPEHVQQFLLQTSILESLTGPLCDAVTGRADASAMLEWLDRANLFVIPLDDHRSWYRYHRLFADVLHARLMDDRRDRGQELHRRASGWFEQNGDRDRAIRHAIAGEDFERAADLVEMAIPVLRQARQEARLRHWMESLPGDLFPSRPVLSVGYVGTLMASGESEGVETLLRAAERCLDDAGRPVRVPDATMTVANTDEWRRLPSAIALYRAAQARIAGDEEGALGHARRAVDLAGPDDHLERGGAAGFLALAHWTDGDLDAAHGFWSDAMDSLQKAGHLSDVLGCAISQADIRIAQGRLGDAKTIYERGLRLATDPAGNVRRGATDMHLGMCEVLLERNDLDGARRHLHEARELGDELGLPRSRYRSCVAAARIRHVEGDVDGALALLDEAERLYFTDFSPDVRPIPALRAKLLLLEGRVPEAVAWAEASGLKIDDELSYRREFEHTTLARILLRQAEETGQVGVGDVVSLTDRLLDAAERGGRVASAIEILIVRSQALDADSREAAAVDSLETAIHLAAPEGHVGVFVTEGGWIAPLLTLAAQRPGAPGHARRLVAARGHAPAGPPSRVGLVQPLTEREVEVLRLLGSELAGPAIARELYVSLNTLRTHTKSIYTKLGVNSRRAAVRRAAELEILPSPHRSR